MTQAKPPIKAVTQSRLQDGGDMDIDAGRHVEIGLNAAIVSVIDRTPMILTVTATGGLDALPYGPFDPTSHRTMEIGLRGLVEKQTSLGIGYVEQLYTFGDRGRLRAEADDSPHVVSVGYLALTRARNDGPVPLHMDGAEWKGWYAYFPWEDWRNGRPAVLDDVILPELDRWANRTDHPHKQVRGLTPMARVRLAFGVNGGTWDEEQVLERYELLYSAGLIDEAVSDGRYEETNSPVQLGIPMLHDHRRIVATAISRLRSKLKYRPVIFELMPDEFTLYQLQQTVESISGRAIHKQNFRRLVEHNQLVEPTGATSSATGGRPAALFRFRRDVIEERPAPGLRVGRG